MRFEAGQEYRPTAARRKRWRIAARVSALRPSLMALNRAQPSKIDIFAGSGKFLPSLFAYPPCIRHSIATETPTPRAPRACDGGPSARLGCGRG
jgi:hypothetical protein